MSTPTFTKGNILQDYAKTLKADGSVEQINLGAFTYCFFLQAAGSFQWSLDGVTFVTGYQGMSIGPFSEAKSISMKSINGLANSIVVYISDFKIAYYPNTRTPSTFTRGNGGTSTLLTVNPGSSYTIPAGNYNGHQRKHIIISVSTSGGGNHVCDSNGNHGFYISNAAPLILESDDVLIFKNDSNLNGGPNVATNLYYFEIYYVN